MEQLSSFDWDAASIGHIFRHAITPFEVEEVVERLHVALAANLVNGEERWKLLGKISSGRYLVIVYTVRDRLFPHGYRL